MAALKGPIICPLPIHTPLKKRAGHLQGGFWVCRPQSKSLIGASGFLHKSCLRNNWPLYSSLNSPSGDSGSIAGNYKESDEDYVDCTVIEAVEVRSGPHGLSIKMLDGTNMRCVFNNPDTVPLPDTSPYPVIVLKMEDGSGLLLPITVVEQPNAMLMDAVRDVKTERPTVYEVLKEMIDTMGYEVRLARITRRNREIYVARLYLSQVGNEQHGKVLDIKPSDAINIAVCCKAQIQVNKHLAYNDGVTVVDPPVQYIPFFSEPFRYLDRVRSNYEEEEFDLIKNMMDAASQERYKDAAQYRDRLYQLRLKRKK
ncbi:bifunctional nuclease 2-like isoform X1 [Carex littledalei]|uniref:Bifunctional nuclease 2-like isoform X1 n=1 Tax=Carex littledalei TaxID=544730 RepID=A0A833VHM1_9POAL|nr:bifunctional nuclease 2-like isoform X1 [Carex littledalei]